MMTYLQWIWAWISAHPAQTAVYAWMVFNVVWAQCPQPKNPTLAKLWNFSHSLLQLVVTHAGEPGTFKLPWLIQAAASLLSSANVVPPSIVVGTTGADAPKTTANDAGDSHDDRSA